MRAENKGYKEKGMWCREKGQPPWPLQPSGPRALSAFLLPLSLPPPGCSPSCLHLTHISFSPHHRPAGPLHQPSHRWVHPSPARTQSAHPMPIPPLLQGPALLHSPHSDCFFCCIKYRLQSLHWAMDRIPLDFPPSLLREVAHSTISQGQDQVPSFFLPSSLPLLPPLSPTAPNNGP